MSLGGRALVIKIPEITGRVRCRERLGNTVPEMGKWV